MIVMKIFLAISVDAMHTFFYLYSIRYRYKLVTFSIDIDYVTPLCSQVTYEGLVDDIFDIKSGRSCQLIINIINVMVPDFSREV